MKETARIYVWWPRLNKDITKISEMCNRCQLFKENFPQRLLHHWPVACTVGEMVHVDLAGPIHQVHWLILVDAYSKWPEIARLNNTTSKALLTALECIFNHLGYPRNLITDNGPQFVSHEFNQYCDRHGITHIYTPPSNGIAERFVRTFKNAIRGFPRTEIQTQLTNFLIAYRNTPHPTTKQTPAMRYLGRKIRRPLDLLHEKSAFRTTHYPVQPDLRKGDLVWVRTPPSIPNPRWEKVYFRRN
ncbi:unnamed protein product [Gordionus sp. m RMFG-2023]